MDHRKSIAEFKRAQNYLVGGVNSPVRAFKGVKGNPLVVDYGKGKKIFDIDGNGFTDYCLSWGALILGHAHPEVMKAIKKGLKHAVSFGTTTKPEIEIAEFIVKHVPSVEQVRFVNSGTEATMSAIRLSRGVTKRNIVIKFDGCYHGHADDLLAVAGSGVANLPASSSQGVPPEHLKNTLSLPFNDTKRCLEVFERLGKNIAGVIVEPVAGNMGVVVPEKGFLKMLRDVTVKSLSIFIFDEVMTGFRTHLGCVQSEFDIWPDITCFGKIIGGGFPVGAYGGRKDIMNHLAPNGGVYQAGTFSGNPIVMRAGLATLKSLHKKLFDNLGEMTDDFVDQVNDAFRAKNLNIHAVNYKSMVSLRFREKKVVNYLDAQNAGSTEVYSRLFHFLLAKGIYLPPADLESFFLSSRHTTKDLNYLGKCLTEFNDAY
ncbi:MAG: glutamate-1-semialdehyde 2,1-aminomutase [Candidatus Omnitrophica bacterium]|nr:glutamate-1-semialdehyde 2,1-aminomutase [Candidatus Omnitrophota bacterium]